jgi:methionyl-tRNA formyltransferase
MGSPRFALPSLHAVLEAGHHVALVVTQPPQPAGRGRRLAESAVASAAAQLGIPLFQPERVRRPDVVERIRQEQPEAILIAAYGQLLPRSLLDIPPLGVLNVHPSLLPRHRGPSPIPAAILAGDDRTGVSIMLVDEGMDSGPVLARTEIPIAGTDDAATLGLRLADVGAELLAETLGRWADSEIVPQPQDDGKATVSRLLRRADGALDWNEPAEALWRRVRAVAEWPQAFTSWDGKLVRILAAEVDLEGSAAPGSVGALGSRARAPNAATIGTGTGLLLPQIVGIEGRRPMPIDAFLRGYPAFIGARLRTPSGIIDTE